MDVSDMPSGTDADELFTDQTTKTVFVPYKGKKWEFEVRALTWEEEGELVSASTKMSVKKGQKGQAEAAFAVNTYNWLHIKKRVVKGPFPINEATRRKISPAFGNLMVQYLVTSDDDVSEDESKNSDEL
jgi:hypothetical protein